MKKRVDNAIFRWGLILANFEPTVVGPLTHIGSLS